MTAAAGGWIYAPAQDEGPTQSHWQGKPVQRDAVPNPQRRRNNTRHSHPKAHRRQGRRSNTRQDIRTNVRRRPSTNPSQSGTANPNAHRRQSRRSNARLKQPHPRETKDLNNCVRENSPAQRESQDPNNPHPSAASRASGSNCGRRCSRTYPA